MQDAIFFCLLYLHLLARYEDLHVACPTVFILIYNQIFYCFLLSLFINYIINETKISDKGPELLYKHVAPQEGLIYMYVCMIRFKNEIKKV